MGQESKQNELFRHIRDVLEQQLGSEGVRSEALWRAARQATRFVVDYSSAGWSVAGRSAHLSTTVSMRAAEHLRGMAFRLEEATGLRVSSGSGRETLPLWTGLVGHALGLAVALIDAGRSNVHVLSAVAGYEGLTLGPPIVLQSGKGRLARLLYWSAVLGLFRAAHLAAPDLAPEVSIGPADGLPDAPKEPEPDADAPAQRRFVWYYRRLAHDVLCFRMLSAFQWNATGYLGRLVGFDGLALSWCVRALTHGPWELREGVWEDAIRKPDLVLDLAGFVLRHTPFRETFVKLPVMQIRKLEHDGQATGFRLQVNHPFVLRKELDSMIGRALRQVRQGGGRALAASETQFLEAVANAGLNRESKAPRGFWPGFVRGWNKGRRGKRLTATHARVRYHRLVRRLRADRPQQ
jgi:hypothetical protein